MKTLSVVREAMAEGERDRVSTRDLLAVVVGSIDQANQLLDLYGSIHGVQRASAHELGRVPGIGPARVCSLQAALELGRRVATEGRQRGQAIRTAADVFHVLGPRLRHLQHETFWALYLNVRHQVLREVMIAKGGLTACAIHPREVFEPALREAASAIVVAHNHPSGDATPSHEDLALTARLVLSAGALGVRILDHVVIGDGSYVSMADRGLMGR